MRIRVFWSLLLALLLPLAGCKPEPAAIAPTPSVSAAQIAPTQPATQVAPPKGAVLEECTKVVDGDTLVTNGKREIRLIGIDSPESGWYGYDDARQYLAGLAKGKQLALLIDAKNPKDKYDRTRALLYVQKDGKWLLINQAMVASGWAIVSVYSTSPADPNKWMPDQQRAQAGKLGAWQKYKTPEDFDQGKRALHASQEERQKAQTATTKADAPAGHKYVGNTRSMKFHRLDCKYLPSRSNARYLQSREEAIKQGFKPCNVCHP